MVTMSVTMVVNTMTVVTTKIGRNRGQQRRRHTESKSRLRGPADACTAGLGYIHGDNQNSEGIWPCGTRTFGGWVDGERHGSQTSNYPTSIGIYKMCAMHRAEPCCVCREISCPPSPLPLPLPAARCLCVLPLVLVEPPSRVLHHRMRLDLFLLLGTRLPDDG